MTHSEDVQDAVADAYTNVADLLCPDLRAGITAIEVALDQVGERISGKRIMDLLLMHLWEQTQGLHINEEVCQMLTVSGHRALFTKKEVLELLSRIDQELLSLAT